MKAEAPRIAMISAHSSPMGELGARHTGGMSVYIGEVSQRLAKRGYAIDIFTRTESPSSSSITEPFKNVRLIQLHAGPRKSLEQMELARHLPEFFKGLEQFRASQQIRYSLIHSHYYLSGLIGHRAHRLWHVPHVFTFHTVGALKNRIGDCAKEPELRLRMEKNLASQCDLILAATHKEKFHLIELYGSQISRKIRVVPCGVDLEKFKPFDQTQSKAKLGLKGSKRVILYVGRFDPVKGVNMLLEAAARLRGDMDFCVLVVGGTSLGAPEDQTIRALCSSLFLEDCVTFVGPKANDELPDYYCAADVLVVPSHYESFGLVILEALACGTPVVASRVGAVEDIVRNGLNGWIVPENTPESLANGLRRFFEHQTDKNAAADSIRQTVKKYDWNHTAASIDGQYRQLLGSLIEKRDALERKIQSER